MLKVQLISFVCLNEESEKYENYILIINVFCKFKFKKKKIFTRECQLILNNNNNNNNNNKNTHLVRKKDPSSLAVHFSPSLFIPSKKNCSFFQMI